MKIRLNKKLFWFLKDNVEIDSADSTALEMYVQQVVSQGRTEDVKSLLANVDSKQLNQVFSKIKRFLSWEVRAFWEDFFADHQ
jgi:hypothetical protein